MRAISLRPSPRFSHGSTMINGRAGPQENSPYEIWAVHVSGVRRHGETEEIYLSDVERAINNTDFFIGPEMGCIIDRLAAKGARLSGRPDARGIHSVLRRPTPVDGPRLA